LVEVVPHWKITEPIPRLQSLLSPSGLPATALTPAAVTSTVVSTTVAVTFTAVAATDTAVSATVTTAQPEQSEVHKVRKTRHTFVS
jgi:hypothetical protein